MTSLQQTTELRQYQRGVDAYNSDVLDSLRRENRALSALIGLYANRAADDLPPRNAAEHTGSQINLVLNGGGLEQLIDDAILAVHVGTSGSSAEKAKRLGVDRRTFYRKLARMGVTFCFLCGLLFSVSSKLSAQTKGDGAKALIKPVFYSLADVIQDFNAKNRSELVRLRALPNYGQRSLIAPPITGTNYWHGFYPFVDGLKRGVNTNGTTVWVPLEIPFPQPGVEFSYESAPTPSGPWTVLLTTTNNFAVYQRDKAQEFHRVGRHDK